MTQKLRLEFILHMHEPSPGAVKNSLAEFGEGLEISDLCQGTNTKGRDFKVRINTEEPEIIFDICAQFGRIRTVKASEVK
ncbi:MAG: hypothetical protein WC723_06190 [Candidatus Omnitrophota bacterium]